MLIGGTATIAQRLEDTPLTLDNSRSIYDLNTVPLKYLAQQLLTLFNASI